MDNKIPTSVFEEFLGNFGNEKEFRLSDISIRKPQKSPFWEDVFKEPLGKQEIRAIFTALELTDAMENKQDKYILILRMVNRYKPKESNILNYFESMIQIKSDQNPEIKDENLLPYLAQGALTLRRDFDFEEEFCNHIRALASRKDSKQIAHIKQESQGTDGLYEWCKVLVCNLLMEGDKFKSEGEVDMALLRNHFRNPICYSVLLLEEVIKILKGEKKCLPKMETENYRIIDEVHDNMNSLINFFQNNTYMEADKVIFAGNFFPKSEDPLKTFPLTLILALKYMEPSKYHIMASYNEYLWSSKPGKILGYYDDQREKISELCNEMPCGFIINSNRILLGGLPTKVFRLSDLENLEKPNNGNSCPWIVWRYPFNYSISSYEDKEEYFGDNIAYRIYYYLENCIESDGYRKCEKKFSTPKKPVRNDELNHPPIKTNQARVTSSQKRQGETSDRREMEGGSIEFREANSVLNEQNMPVKTYEGIYQGLTSAKSQSAGQFQMIRQNEISPS